MRVLPILFTLLFVSATAFAQNPADARFLPSKSTDAFDPNGILGKPKSIVVDAEPEVAEPRIWSGGMSFGLDGSVGNSPLFNMRVGGELKRKTDDNIFDTEISYLYATQNREMIKNRALWYARDEVLFKDSPWTLFGSSQMEYDQFRAVDFRYGLYGGVGRTLLDTETTKMRARVGGGATREIGGPQDRWIPELLLGWELEHEFTDRQRIVAAADVFPNLAYLGRWRLRARVAYEIILAPEWGLTLRIGAQERYDSTPGNAKRNDLDYFTALLFRF